MEQHWLMANRVTLSNRPLSVEIEAVIILLIS